MLEGSCNGDGDLRGEQAAALEGVDVLTGNLWGEQVAALEGVDVRLLAIFGVKRLLRWKGWMAPRALSAP